MLASSIHAVCVAGVVNCNKLTFSLFKIVRGESKQFSIVHLHKIFKISNLNDAKLVMDGLVISSYISAPNDLDPDLTSFMVIKLLNNAKSFGNCLLIII